MGSPSDVASSRPAGALALRTRRTGALLALCGLAFVVCGCSSVKQGENADLITGKQLFVAKCGSCHTLARAETKGIVGPDLDNAFRADVELGLQRNAIRGVVQGQVENPNPNGVMPHGLASGAQLNDIASYVAESVDRKGSDTGLLASAVKAAGEGKPVVEKAGKLAIEANPQGQLAYTTKKAIATPGAVTISMTNMSGVMHNVAIESGSGGASGSGPVLAHTEFQTKGTVSVTVNLKPGTYTFFCQAPGHRAAGMYGTLTVK